LFAKLPPAVTALLLQLAAFALAVLSLRVAGLQVTPLSFALLCGGYAATLSHFAGLARWWLAIQFVFVPALVLMQAFDIPPGFFLAAFLVLLVVYWSTFRTQVPLPGRLPGPAGGVLEPLPHPGAALPVERQGVACAGIIPPLSR